MRSSRWCREAIAEKKLPGAVVLVGRGERILYQKAIGNRALVPAVEPMTLDTIFDLASLTKVVATTTSVMILVEQGQDPAERSRRVLHPGVRALRQGRHHHPAPAHARLGSAAGCRSRARCGPASETRDRARDRGSADVASRRAIRLQRHQLLPARRHRPPRERPAARSRSRASAIFEPLGMKDTMFNPCRRRCVPRIAPTEKLHAVRLALRRAGR